MAIYSVYHSKYMYVLPDIIPPCTPVRTPHTQIRDYVMLFIQHPYGLGLLQKLEPAGLSCNASTSINFERLYPSQVVGTPNFTPIVAPFCGRVRFPFTVRKCVHNSPIRHVQDPYNVRIRT